MFNPASAPLAQPTVYSHNISVPLGFPGSYTNGPVQVNPNGLDSLPHVGNIGTTSLYNKGRIYDSSQLHANGRITAPYYQDKDNFKRHYLTAEQLVFGRIASAGKFMNTEGIEMFGVSMLNYKLLYDPAFAHYGQESDCTKFRKDFRFLGCAVSQETAYSDAASAAHVQTITVQGSCHTWSLWHAIKNGSTHLGGARSGDLLQFAIVRVDKPNPLQEQFRLSDSWSADPLTGKPQLLKRKEEDVEEPSNKKKRNKDKRLQLVPYLANDHQKVELYREPPKFDKEGNMIDEGFMGDSITMGIVGETYRSDELTIPSVNKARNALCPSADNDEYLKDLYTLPKIQLFLGCA